MMTIIYPELYMQGSLMKETLVSMVTLFILNKGQIKQFSGL